MPFLLFFWFIADAELVFNQIAKAFFNLCMPWNRCFFPVLGIYINIVASAMSFQVAAGFNQFTDKVKALQASTPISL